MNWSDFWVGERDVATVNGKVIGIPALVDNLAVVYNKTLFASAGLPAAGPGLDLEPVHDRRAEADESREEAVRHRLRDAR